MKLRLFDLHCDTPYELYKKQASFDKNNLHISLDRAADFFPYVQISAVWSDHRLSDEDAYTQFRSITQSFKNELQKNSDIACLVRSCVNIDAAILDERAAFILAVEDARILAGDIDRLSTLYDAGVRLLTLLWQGESCVGGAFDTDAPLTQFGRTVLKRCFEMGIIPDISHASRPVIDEVIEEAIKVGKPFLASHSNAYDICPHKRNLSGKHFKSLIDSGGVVGISLAPQHLTLEKNKCTIEDILRHIDYYLSHGGENSLCLGCDFDGIDQTPSGIDNISKLYRLADALSQQNYSDTLIDRIFFTNAYEFANKNLIQ